MAKSRRHRCLDSPTRSLNPYKLMARNRTRAQKTIARNLRLQTEPLPQTTTGETISKTIEVTPKHHASILASLRRHQTISFDERGRIIELRNNDSQIVAPAHVVRSQWYMILRAFFFQPTLNRNEISHHRFGDESTPCLIKSEGWRDWNFGANA